MPWRLLRLEEHFELARANFVRCEECDEDFFFDFLRHPRYFVAHFKSCHLKNLLYRFNGYSEEENARTRFGPRRKRDATSWFAQLKSTEKRMVSMQDNKWSEISERECWSCRRCNDGKADLTHVFEMSELGRGQAILHLRQVHERLYEEFLRRLPAVENGRALLADVGPPASPSSQSRAWMCLSDDAPPAASTSNSSNDGGDARGGPVSAASPAAVTTAAALGLGLGALGEDAGRSSGRELQHRLAEAERSRLRRLQASDETRHVEALRSKKRRESLTPAQRHADYERRQVKEKRQAQAERIRQRREQATDASRERELVRSRERRRNATTEQRQREAERSKRRRENTSEEQRAKERERCKKRYEAKKKTEHPLLGTRDDAGAWRPRSPASSSRAGSDDERLPEPERRHRRDPDSRQSSSGILTSAVAHADSERDDT